MAPRDIATPLDLRAHLPEGASLRQLRTAIGGLKDAVLVADRHGRYVAANGAACRLTGFTERELLTRALPDLTGIRDADVADVLWRAFLEQKYQRGEFALQRADGLPVTVHYEALADVVPGYHVSFLRPITS